MTWYISENHMGSQFRPNRRDDIPHVWASKDSGRTISSFSFQTLVSRYNWVQKYFLNVYRKVSKCFLKNTTREVHPVISFFLLKTMTYQLKTLSKIYKALESDGDASIHQKLTFEKGDELNEEEWKKVILLACRSVQLP